MHGWRRGCREALLPSNRVAQPFPPPRWGRPCMSRPLLRRLLAALVVLLLAAPSAQADQFSFVSLPQAKAALQHLHAGDVVHHFCAPCDEVRSERMTVRSLGIERIWAARGSSKVYRDPDGAGWWQVQLNDESVDLAYVYVRDGTRWRNLADLLGLQPWHVPAVLPAAAIGTRWRCGARYDNPYWTIFEQRSDPCPIDVAAYEAAGDAAPGRR